MKKVTSFFIILVLAKSVFSQAPNYSITLNSFESFTKITKPQMTDTINLNQTGPEQFEYFEIHITSTEAANIDKFMKTCKSIQSILDKYGRVKLDITMGSNSDIIQPLSGFYYAVEKSKNFPQEKSTLMVIYPRKDKM
jgi:hypothetical protein